MNHQRQDIILPLKAGQIIRKPHSIDCDINTSYQLRYRLRKAMIIFADIFKESLCSRCLCPIRIKIFILYGLYNRIRIVYRSDPLKMISVIPHFHGIKMNIPLLAEFPYLILCKPDKFSKFTRFYHRILFEIRYCRL